MNPKWEQSPIRRKVNVIQVNLSLKIFIYTGEQFH